MKKISTLILLLSFFGLNAQVKKVNLSNGTIKVPAMQYEQFMYGFSEGDKIVFNLNESNNKDLNKIEIFELQSNLKYSNFKTSHIMNKIIDVNKTGIYLFRITNASLGKRICNITIDRIPKDDSTLNFNSNVKKRIINDTTYTSKFEKVLVDSKFVTKTLINNENYWVNSGMNSFFNSGGKSRIAIPIILPKNTVEWYYSFSSTRNKTDIENNMKSMNLASELSGLIDQTGLLSFGINALSKPPGANYCDIYLIDTNNHGKFLSKEAFSYNPSTSRENLISGVVKIKSI